jgi:hypothetical protein
MTKEGGSVVHLGRGRVGRLGGGELSESGIASHAPLILSALSDSLHVTSPVLTPGPGFTLRRPGSASAIPNIRKCSFVRHLPLFGTLNIVIRPTIESITPSYDDAQQLRA